MNNLASSLQKLKEQTTAIVFQEFSNPNLLCWECFFSSSSSIVVTLPNYHDFHRFHASLSWTLQKASVSHKALWSGLIDHWFHLIRPNIQTLFLRGGTLGEVVYLGVFLYGTYVHRHFHLLFLQVLFLGCFWKGVESQNKPETKPKNWELSAFATQRGKKNPSWSVNFRNHLCTEVNFNINLAL